jgi:hypothetical protein
MYLDHRDDQKSGKCGINEQTHEYANIMIYETERPGTLPDHPLS